MKVLLTLLFVISPLSISQSKAALGQGPESIEKDRLFVSGIQKTPKAHALYTAHEIANDHNTVKEYVSPEGKVFAVTWLGATQPNLAPLLGDYYSDYQTTLKNMPRRHGKRFSRAVQGKDVVVETKGHMRALSGLAYVPALVPEGVNVHALP